MTSYTIYALIFLLGINGGDGAQDPINAYKWSLTNIRELCWRDLPVSGNDPAVDDVGYRMGFILMECDPRLFLRCKEQEDTTFRCTCEYMGDPNNANECLPPPPSKSYDEPCSFLEPCRHPYVCPYRPYENENCECPRDRPIHNATTSSCLKRAYGDTCIQNANDCAANLMCTKGKCECTANRPHWNARKKRCEGAHYGESCDNADKPCYTDVGLSCIGGKCVCSIANKPNWDANHKECGQGYDKACDDKNQCVRTLRCSPPRNMCECYHPARFDAKLIECVDRPTYGEHCEPYVPRLDDFPECSHDTFACLSNGQSGDKTCQCKFKTQKPDSANFSCVTKPSASAGGPCKDHDDCYPQADLMCTNGICSCASDRLWHEGKCALKTSMRKCDPKRKPDPCQIPVGANLRCDVKEKLCTCSNKTEYASWANACKLIAGENCVQDKTYHHDLCASGQCAQEDGKCVCPKSPEGVERIWSSEPEHGCIFNYYNRPCYEGSGPEECIPPGNYNSSRQGLVCIDGKCQCGGGLSFVSGYCIKANMTYGEENCDDRFGNTCQIDPMTSLTCTNTGNGVSICLCLPYEIDPSIAKGVKVPMEWNASEKKCQLKSTGSRCARGYECKSGWCEPSTSRCGVARRRFGAGSRIRPLVAFKVPVAWILANVLFH